MKPFHRSRIYLDHAAATPPSRGALRAFKRALTASGNPSSPHAEGREAKNILEDARARVARLAGVKPDAVIFTSGATEANALGIEGHVRALDHAEPHVLYLPSAHASVLGAIHRIEALGATTEALVLLDGAIDLKKLESQIRPETVLVVVDVVCGETGTLHKVRDVRRVLDRVRSGITLFADASQAPRVESFELQHLGADMLSLDAQKVGGVRGIGALIAPRQVPLASLIEGGGQERGLRPGTESHALAAAFATALEECADERTAFVERAQKMRSGFLSSLTIDRMEVNEGKLQAPHILNVSLLGRDTDYLVALMDEAGFAVSTKSACETNEEGSRAVLAMTGDHERARATLRISWSPRTTAAELRSCARALMTQVRFMDQNAL